VRRLVRSTAILGLGSAATIVAAILRAKILAAWLGPEGTGVLAQLAGLTAVLVPLATLGAGNGVVTLIAEARGRDDAARVRRITRTITSLAWAVGLGLALIVAAASPWIAHGIYKDSGFVWAILLAAASVPLSAVASLRITMLQGHGAVRAMATLNAVIAAVGIATIIPMAWFFGVKGAVAQLVVIAATQAWLSGRFLRPLTPSLPNDAARAARAAGTPPAGEPWIDRTLLPPIARFGGSALLVGLSSTLTLLVLRSILVGKLGLSQNGIYQVCIGVSGLTMPLILNSITATVWPEIAAKPKDADAVGPMRGGIRLAFLLVTGVSAALLVGSPIWVPLFYSAKFLPALDLLPFQFLGDYLRAAAWMFGIWLVPRERLRPWVLFDVVYGVVLLTVFLLLVDRIGIRSVVYAYVAAHLSHAVLHYMLARRALGFRLGKENALLLGASLALLIGLTVLHPRNLVGVGIGAAAAVAWALLVVQRREWIALRDMLFRFIGRTRRTVPPER
jgi:PST family polysaccharide transporter